MYFVTLGLELLPSDLIRGQGPVIPALCRDPVRNVKHAASKDGAFLMVALSWLSSPQVLGHS